ncbi:lysylphosphatidylglycerol synthase transmembrane domain-containing protein [Jatrophihabitans sp. YIM 134969]
MSAEDAHPGTGGGTTSPTRSRHWWRPVLVLVVLGVAVHVLLPQVDELRRTLNSLDDAHWWYLPPAIVCAALTFPGAAWSLAGATTHRLPLGRTSEACLAAACLGRIAPANLGSLGVTGAYLRASGATVGETTAALGLDAIAGVVVHLALLAAAGALVGRFPHPQLKLPDHFAVIVVVALVLAVAGLAAAGYWYRRRHVDGWGGLVHRLVNSLREGRAGFAAALRSPRQAALLLGGSALITVAEIACLGFSILAFDGRVGVVTVAFVYLAGAAVSAVAPTPGGLGAIEAALVSGLTLFGVASGPAVTGVLLYRLLTFWLPILPGAVAVRDLRRRHLL